MMDAGTFATVYAVFLFIGIMIALSIFAFAWRNRQDSGAMPLMVLMAGEILWMLFYALQLVDFIHPASRPYFWSKLTFLGIVMIPASFFVWTAYFTQHENWITPFTLIFLSIEPIVMNLVIWTDPWHGWFSGSFQTTGQLGIAFYIHTLYSYLLLLTGAIMQFFHLLRAPPNYRVQAFVVITSMPVATVFNVISISFMKQLGLDFSPVGLLVAGIILFYAQWRHRLFDILPVARHKVMDEILDGVVVVDNEDRIIDMNPAAGRILKTGNKISHGLTAEEIIPSWKKLIENSPGQENRKLEFTIAGEAPRHIAMTMSFMFKKQSKPRGKLIMLRDITDRKNAEKELKSLINNLQKALDEIKTLKGIVPICSHCKKIRDDKGFWEQVDAYVTKHTDASFSHSICPECERKLYPEFQEDFEDLD